MQRPDLIRPEAKEIRSAGRSLLLMASGAAALFVLLLWGLGVLSGMTDNGAHAIGPAIDFETNSVSLSTTQDPPNLDSIRTQDTQSGFVLGHVMEGLLRMDEHDQVVPTLRHVWLRSQKCNVS